MVSKEQQIACVSVRLRHLNCDGRVQYTVCGARTAAICALTLQSVKFGDQGLCSLAVLQGFLLHAGMGRYGQDLHNTACLALKQTNLLKKKSANRTTKTVRQLRNAKEHSCEAAQKAVEATKAAEKAVQNMAQFAGKLLSSSPAYMCDSCMHLLP